MADLKIQVLSRKLIKPYVPTPDHLRCYNLSVFDVLVPPIYSPILYYYYLSEGDSKGRARHEERCDKLEKSLSQILTKFYPLAGRYMENECCVHCGDQGVECIEAQVKGELSHFLQPSDLQMHILSEFLPWDTTTAKHLSISPLFAVQINTFDCGGIVLGISISHLVVDGFTLAAFMKEWAKTSRTGMIGEFCPRFGQLSSLFPGRNCSLPQVPAASPNGANVVTKMFLFEETRISAIKEYLDCPFSKVVVVIAVVWKALLQVALAKHGCYRDSILKLVMNLRGMSKVSAPTLENTCGNYYIPVMVSFEAKSANPQLHDLMILIRSAVEKERARFEGASTDDISLMYIKRREEIIQEQCRSDVDIYFAAIVCGFPMYEADFGWGKPHWVSDARRPAQGVALMDSNKGGIQAFVTLGEANMNEFQKSMNSSLNFSQSRL